MDVAQLIVIRPISNGQFTKKIDRRILLGKLTV